LKITKLFIDKQVFFLQYLFINILHKKRAQIFAPSENKNT